MMLTELLEDVLDNVEDAGDNACEPIREPYLAELITEHVDTALDRIESALRQLQDVGTARDDLAMTDLEAVVDACTQFARQALDEHNADRACDTIIGDHLKTIRQLLVQPGGFKDLAGINSL